MTDQNNAAQAAILSLMLPEQPGLAATVDAGYAAYRRGYNSAIGDAARVLSKLRALGVQADDERAAFEAAWREVNSPLPMNTRRHDDGRYAIPDIEREWRLWQRRAALASAPVAGEAVAIPLRPLNEDERAAIEFYTLNPTAAVRDLDKRLSGNAAPQASAEPLARYCPGCGSVGSVGYEYRDCCPDGNQARMIPARLAEQCRDTFRLAIQTLLADAAANDRAAPRASEAVRILFPTRLRKMWSGGEVQAWLDNHQGITPAKPSAKGSPVLDMDWKAEQAEADKDGVRNKGRQ